MNIAIDILLCLLGIFTVIKYTARGFVRSVFGALKFSLSIAVAYIFTPIIFAFQGLTETIVAYLLVFAASYVILSVIAMIIDKIFKLPILKTANKLLGFLLGIVCAYMILSVIVSLLSLLIAISSEQLFGQTAKEFCESTYVYRFFINSGLFPNAGK